MKTLLLLRHAKSSWEAPGLVDHDRPLAPRGRRAAKKLTRHMRESEIAPELVLCSTSTRTRETLDGIPSALGDPEVRFASELYAASAETLLDAVCAVEPAVAATLVIAHNPGLHDLALQLVGSGDEDARLRLRENLPTGALVTLAFDVETWDEVEPGSGELVGYVVPRELRLTTMRSDLPSGTVTFLFTDIEGSTALLHELGAEAYADALAEHRRVLRDAFARHGGVEVDTQGDAFFVVFSTAPGALQAAAEGRDCLADGPIRVRMGLHTGAPHLGEEGYVGADVHRAARIAAAAHGGQIVVSASTAVLADEPALHDLGEHRLKDLSASERLYQFGDGEFPPLQSLHRTNLPVPSTPFVGRERELPEVAGFLSKENLRLLTLTGPGGTGKTRLALQAAGLCSYSYPDGVYWVPLGALRDPELVLEAAAGALGAADSLVSYIGSKRLLLLFDNFEQVVEAASGLAELLASCHSLTLLVTSREPLHLTAEQVYPVPPFAHQEGVGFFLARARAVEPDFLPEEAVSEICRRLDDLPLALELAAVRVNALTAGQILERLEERLPLLTGGARDLPERHRTLRATIAWSYELLTETEQRLFRRLSVFAGGCTLAAAEEVAGADLDTLQSLVEKSLLRRTDERFWMLETIREYASDQLRESAEMDELQLRHAEAFLALAESANLSVEGIGEPPRYELVIPEAENLRAAIDWAVAEVEFELAASIAVALEQYWVSSSPHEGVRRLDELVERDLPAPLRARALRVRGGTSYIVGDFEEGTRWHELSLAEFRRLGDEAGIAHVLFRLAVEANRAGDSDRARALCGESMSLHPTTWGQAEVLDLLGTIAFHEGRGDEALDLLEESARLAGEAGSVWAQAHSLLGYADCALRLGRCAAAAPAVRESLAISRPIGDRQWVVYGAAVLAWVAVEEDRAEDAGRLWGALEAEVERAPVGQWEDERDDYATHIVRTTPDFERGRAEGRRMSLDAALEDALGDA